MPWMHGRGIDTVRLKKGFKIDFLILFDTFYNIFSFEFSSCFFYLAFVISKVLSHVPEKKNSVNFFA